MSDYSIGRSDDLVGRSDYSDEKSFRNNFPEAKMEPKVLVQGDTGCVRSPEIPEFDERRGWVLIGQDGQDSQDGQDRLHPTATPCKSSTRFETFRT